MTSVVMLCAVVGFGLFITGAPGRSSSELGIDQWLSLRHTPLLNSIALAIAWLFDPPMAVALTIASAALVALITRNPARVLTFLGIIAVAWGGSAVLKVIVQRPRPDAALLAHPLLAENSFSYPSGHTCFIAALSLAVIFLFRDHPRRRAIVVAAGLATLLVGVSRVYLGVHYPTDVIASIVYSAAAAVLALVVWLEHVLPHLPTRFSMKQPVVRLDLGPHDLEGRASDDRNEATPASHRR
jgi:undecaprenyl-diphosphatase